MTKASPRPWHEGHNENNYAEVYRGGGIYSATGELIAEVLESLRYPGNAELIIRAVNRDGHFDGVVAALEAAATRLDVMAETLEQRSRRSRSGGWPTHLCSPMEGQANTLRRDASVARKALRLIQNDKTSR